MNCEGNLALPLGTVGKVRAKPKKRRVSETKGDFKAVIEC